MIVASLNVYVIGSSFHLNFPQFSLEAWQINNDLTIDLMKRIFEYTGTYGLVLTHILTLRSKTMIDEDEYDIIDNNIGNYDNSFQPGSFVDTL